MIAEYIDYASGNMGEADTEAFLRKLATSPLRWLLGKRTRRASREVLSNGKDLP